MSERGDYVILDNGAFEHNTPYDPTRLVGLGKKCGATTIVLPDYPFQPGKKTITGAIRYAPLFKDAGFSTLFVPQSTTNHLEDWIDAYVWATSNTHMIDAIGMSILGCPNALPHIPKQYARVVMTSLLIDRGLFAYNMYHHYLGLNCGSNVEIPSLISMNVLDSCDSSGPIWWGIQGISYNPTYSDFAGVNKKYIRPVNFDEPLYDQPHIAQIIQFNLDRTIATFTDPAAYL
jgi:hypothetical protein